MNDPSLLVFVQLADRTFILTGGFLFIAIGFFEPLA